MRYFKDERRRAAVNDPLEHQPRLARELLGEQRAEGVGARTSPRATRTWRCSICRASSAATTRRPTGSSTRIVQASKTPCRGAARPRRQQARRLDQDPRQDLRALARAARRRRLEDVGHEEARARRTRSTRSGSSCSSSSRRSSRRCTHNGPGARAADRRRSREKAPKSYEAGRLAARGADKTGSCSSSQEARSDGSVVPWSLSHDPKVERAAQSPSIEADRARHDRHVSIDTTKKSA